MRVPTKQIDQECDRHKLTPSSGKFLRAIFRKAKEYYQKFLVNFHDLNREVTKKRHKGVYGAATINAVRNQIIDLPFIKVKRQHSSYIFELIMKTLKESK